MNYFPCIRKLAIEPVRSPGATLVNEDDITFAADVSKPAGKDSRCRLTGASGERKQRVSGRNLIERRKHYYIERYFAAPARLAILIDFIGSASYLFVHSWHTARM